MLEITSRLVMGKLQASLPSPQTRRDSPPCDLCGRLQVAILSDEWMALSFRSLHASASQTKSMEKGCRELGVVATPNVRMVVLHSRLSFKPYSSMLEEL